jgi:hypothetical protein
LLLLLIDFFVQIDTLLDRKEKEKTEREPGLGGRFITITFLGYYDRKGGGQSSVCLISLSRNLKKVSGAILRYFFSLNP